MEAVGLSMFGGSYRGRRVLVTGHTGFKGSWLVLWLQELGAHVHGLALPPMTQPNHWDLLHAEIDERRGDVRDAALVSDAVREWQPEVVFHLAAQSLVRPSYDDPLGTWATNLMGTAHVLEACRRASSVRAVVVVTSDKCYENRESGVAYREEDPLGGHDPYSASKAGAELVAASWRRSFFQDPGHALVASARAGNVIGGGDWSADRLVPDAVRALATGNPLRVRSPRAVRPWQHVLESLSGYLMLGQRLLEGDRQAAASWNFGPDVEDTCTVQVVLEKFRAHWPAFAWQLDGESQPYEATLLQLDSRKAREQLGWRPVWNLDAALEHTARWYRAFLDEASLVSHTQLRSYMTSASAAGAPWAVE